MPASNQRLAVGDDSRPSFTGFHHAALVALVFMRPLLGGSGAAELPHIVWSLVLALAIVVLAFDVVRGRVVVPRVGLGGWLCAGALVVALPAVFASDDPAMAWGRYLTWCQLLAVAGWIWLMPGDSRRLAWAALAAGMGISALLALAQHVWVLPTMAAQVDALAASHGGQLQAWQLAERIANGGSYAGFAIANNLAIVLIATLPALALTTWRSRGWAQAAGTAACMVALAGLLTTGAKGAVLALVVAFAWVCCWSAQGWRRWLPAVVAFGGAMVAWLVPAIGSHAAASVSVRGDYWHVAAQLIAEAPWLGHGLGDLRTLGGHVLEPGVQRSAEAHNAVLAAWVAGGALGLAAALAVLVAWLRPTGARTAEPAATGSDHSPSTPTPAGQASTAYVPWLPLITLPVWVLIGALVSDNLAFWPFGSDLIGQLVAALALGGAGSGVLAVVLAQPMPPRWICWLGLVTIAVGSLIDFHWVERGVAGSAVVLAVLAAPPPNRAHRSWRWLVGAAALVVVSVTLLASHRWRHLDDADTAFDLLAAGELDAAAAITAGQPGPLGVAQTVDQLARWSSAWPASPGRLVRAARSHPDPTRQLLIAQQAVALAPRDVRTWDCLAEMLAQQGELAAALTALDRASERAPHHPDVRHHQRLVLEALLLRHPDAEAAPAWRQRLREIAESANSSRR